MMGPKRGTVDPASVPTDLVQLLAPDGTLVPDAEYEPDLKKDDLLQIYRYMVLARRADAEATNLQRQGELGVYTPLLGQEAAQVGTAYALDEGDWIFPAYRELAMAIMRKVDPVDVLHMFRGTWHGGTWDVREHRFALYVVPVGTQTIHGAGFAIAAKLDGASIVTLCCMGDGATSEGDFHEGLNFAGVWHAPVVFLCQNNQYAISVPVTRQTAAPTIAVKALGYGFPGVRVDGNDVLACYVVAQEAVRRAREGKGPTLIEAVTYRVGPHSTADDPTRYRTDEELHRWEELDPIARFARYLEGENVITEEDKEKIETEAKELAAHIRSMIVGAGAPPAHELFEHVYSEPSEVLRREQWLFAEELAAREQE